MTIDQTVEKLLLDYRGRLEGMIAKNRLMLIQDKNPEYGEDAFEEVQNEYAGYIQKVGEYDKTRR